MRRFTFSAEDLDAIRHERYHHPHPRGFVPMCRWFPFVSPSPVSFDEFVAAASAVMRAWHDCMPARRAPP